MGICQYWDGVQKRIHQHDNHLYTGTGVLRVWAGLAQALSRCCVVEVVSMCIYNAEAFAAQ
ncbi:hypothetical protein SVAN01_06338 [Stagonosporopsis vannaccii]|nr:hypothetical protein SVAN01_06338 [Stagonosporopsis vannaccii]